MDNKKQVVEAQEQWVTPKVTNISSQETMGGSGVPLDGIGSDIGPGSSS